MQKKYNCYKKIKGQSVFVARFTDKQKAADYQCRHDGIEIKTEQIINEYWLGDSNG